MINYRKIDITIAIITGLCAIASAIGIALGLATLWLSFCAMTFICVTSIIEISNEIKKEKNGKREN